MRGVDAELEAAQARLKAAMKQLSKTAATTSAIT
jgi:hypothetical protein